MKRYFIKSLLALSICAGFYSCEVQEYSDLNIKIPQKGLVVIVEWLIIEDNKREFTVISEGKRKMKIAYAPMFGAVAKNTNKHAMIYRGEWMNSYKNPSQSIKNYKDKYSELAVSLTLTN